MIPDLFLTDELAAGRPVSEPTTIFEKIGRGLLGLFFELNQPENETGEHILFPVSLGAATQSTGQDLILNALANKGNKHVTIFIGSFSDERDIHKTAFGEIHGGLIIMNAYLNLMSQHHYVEPGYAMMLFVLFTLVAWRLIHRIRVISKANTDVTRKFRDRETNDSGFWKGAYYYIEEYFVNPSHYWILLAILLISILFFNRLVNVMAIAIILAAIDFSIRALYKAIIK
jgi:protein-S-isoprenylcysteine O-methyltransferase Ste14